RDAEPVKVVVMMAVKPRDAVLKGAVTMGVELKAVVAPVLNRVVVALVEADLAVKQVVVDHLGADSFSF
ncbi:MAG: hypothetical protein VB912_04685, partial [Pirellulaceae bacterium]